MALWLVNLTPDRAVRVRALAGAVHCVLGQDTKTYFLAASCVTGSLFNYLKQFHGDIWADQLTRCHPGSYLSRLAEHRTNFPMTLCS